MPGGGKLMFKTSNATLEQLSIAGESVSGDFVVISVGDTGNGMSGESLEHIFEPFFTTKDTGKGTGLGLSMVCGFAEQSNGYVSVASEIGVGTTVDLYLPRSIGDAKE